MDVINKSQDVVGEPWGRGWSGSRRRNEGTGLGGGASFALGVARRATPTHCSASCTDCAKGSTGKGEAEEVHPLEASRALKNASAHIKVADGAGVPGVSRTLNRTLRTSHLKPYRTSVLYFSSIFEAYRTNVPYLYHYKKGVPYQRTVLPIKN